MSGNSYLTRVIFFSVRNALVVFALFSMLGGMTVLASSLMLIASLRKEHEKKMVPWLYSFAAFSVFRLFAFVFFSIVNDMIFAYNISMCILWILFICVSTYGWLIVYSLYVELSDLTRLEDLAHLRVSLFALLYRFPFNLLTITTIDRCTFHSRSAPCNH